MVAKFKTIDRAACRVFSEQVMPELNKVLAKFGLAGTYAGGTYDSHGVEMTPKIRIVLLGDAENTADAIADAAKIEYTRRAPMVGLPADSFGQEIYRRGTGYRIAGFNSANSYRILIRRLSDDKPFLLHPDDVAVHLKAAQQSK